MKLNTKPIGIVCAIDVNDFDQDVVDLAGSFAKREQLDLELLHVTLFPDPAQSSWPACLGSTDEIITDNRKLRKIGTTVDGVVVNHHHLSGNPGEKVIEFVEFNQPKLLVLGTHGRSGLARVFGSVATRILRRARCPVMVVRQKHQIEDNSKSKPSRGLKTT